MSCLALMAAVALPIFVALFVAALTAPARTEPKGKKHRAT